jgi:DNA-binding transcriptional LysR family regulator
MGAPHRRRHARDAQEINALRHGLTGQLRIAAIPTALAMVASLTTPFRCAIPTCASRSCRAPSIEVLEQLENLEIDAGVTYLDNEPLGASPRSRSIASATG